MKKWILLGLIGFFIGFSIIRSLGPDYSGEIIEKNLQDEDRPLLVRVESGKKQDNTDAIWLRETKEVQFDQLRTGQHIKVWTTGYLVETKPPIASVKKMEVME